MTGGKMGVACGALKSLSGRRGIKREGAVRKSEFSCSILISNVTDGGAGAFAEERG